MVKTGQRYVSPGGAEMVVTKGGDGELADGDIPLQPKGSEDAFQGAQPAEHAQELALGKRFNAADGAVSVLVTKAGKCDLKYDGISMELQEPRKLPSSD
ncbi:MAG: hypothetical protein CL753_02195 [Chloroflexi bacterium]|nr:hypothetical protein [Chloroflexota bacterium]|tara:strand:+ start:166 stop:462 length:297 start_codon:yes stop_codon:yes gene_type:complete